MLEEQTPIGYMHHVLDVSCIDFAELVLRDHISTIFDCAYNTTLYNKIVTNDSKYLLQIVIENSLCSMDSCSILHRWTTNTRARLPHVLLSSATDRSNIWRETMLSNWLFTWHLLPMRCLRGAKKRQKICLSDELH